MIYTFKIYHIEQELQRTGIRCTDPRLTSMMKMLYNMNPHGLTNVSSMTLDTGAFRTILTKNTWLINKSFQNQFIIPKFHDFCSDITHMYEMVRICIRYFEMKNKTIQLSFQFHYAYLISYLHKIHSAKP